ncbi:Cytosolic Fe-S cluster assembly factor nubp1 [Coelomomyces lativittatus]|nr:Cytosolic Fe-S cluster assembly factor nubp1 [Coelomomyces lativittatus]KAJ1512811.1 Cytosolic Fe-S cluster assembly factor nubp1 [Coelomomyces lativittatus]KAJ1516312.1 Cytosolic Fe-S cluster assembly factor nubp1 [Coelomomyces lativittatus]
MLNSLKPAHFDLNPTPQHCPGPVSEEAGQAAACEGCPNQSICTNLKDSVDPAIQAIQHSMQHIRKKIMVVSGKGGVGKSTVTANLAWTLARMDTHVAVLDVDITGPSIPTFLGVSNCHIHQTSQGWLPVYVDDHLCCMSIGFLLRNKDDAVIWRGPKKTSLIKQFLKDVDWDTTDVLLIDTPPGTSDEHITIVHYLEQTGIDGAIVVTTPQEVALQDVRKEINFLRKVGVKILGVIENMSMFICPECQTSSPIFFPSTGGAQQMCKDMNVPYLGGLPLDPNIMTLSDAGESFIDQFPDSPLTQTYKDLCYHLLGL